MSTNWVQDVFNMHDHFGVHTTVGEKCTTPEGARWLGDFLEFRMKQLYEELGEVENAINVGDPENVVDGLIDLCVFAIGTLDAFGVDAETAWDRVLDANMDKTPGIKPERPNPLGLPDLIKNPGWVAPTHGDNTGIIAVALLGLGNMDARSAARAVWGDHALKPEDSSSIVAPPEIETVTGTRGD